MNKKEYIEKLIQSNKYSIRFKTPKSEKSYRYFECKTKTELLQMEQEELTKYFYVGWSSNQFNGIKIPLFHNNEFLIITLIESGELKNEK